MKLKRIANNLALQTLGYMLRGDEQVHSFLRSGVYAQRTIFEGSYAEFEGGLASTYNNYAVTYVGVQDNQLCIYRN